MSEAVSTGKIAYIMSRFPHLPETFILREMMEMERLGWDISIYPLVLQNQGVIHPDARSFLARAHDLPISSPALLAANLAALFKQPLRYLSLAAQTLWENRSSPKFLSRALVVFPKSVYMAKLMQQEGIQHIHAHFATHPALSAWIIHQLTGIPYSVTVHAHDIYVEKPMLATKLKGAAFVAAISRFNQVYLEKLFGPWVREKTMVIHCGVFPENYTPRSGGSESGSPLSILSIGSLQPYKGQSYLIDACAILRERGIPFHCRIIGGGELHAALTGQISALGLQDRVELAGPKTQEEVARLLPQADLYVQPSIITPTGKMEGIPVSIMEAMVCGVPVIATAISGIPELVQDQKTGCLVPPENGAALADAIEAVFKAPQAAAERAGSARELVLQQFDQHQNARELSDLLTRSIQAGRPQQIKP